MNCAVSRIWSTIALLNKDIFFLFVSIDLTVIKWASDRNRRKCSSHCVNEMKVAILEEMHFWPPMAKITTGCQQLQWWVVLDLQQWQRTCALHKNSNYIVISFWTYSHMSVGYEELFFCVKLFPMLGRGRQITGSPLTQSLSDVNGGHVIIFCCYMSWESMTKRHNIGVLPTWIGAFSKWKVCTKCLSANFKTNVVRMENDHRW